MPSKAEKKKEISDALWRAGVLVWKLRPDQEVIYRQIQDCVTKGEFEFLQLLGRQYGKTHVLVVMGLERALQASVHPDTGEPIPAAVAFLTKTQVQAMSVGRHVANYFLRDDPGWVTSAGTLRPHFEWNEKACELRNTKNDSKICFIGCEGGAVDSHRGKTWDLVLVDEAGHIDRIDEYIEQVFAPAAMKRLAPIVYATTLPRTPRHPFFKILRRLRASGAFVTKTVYDNPTLSPRQIAKLEKEMGGRDSTAFRRECLNEEVYDETDLVVPEWASRAADLTVARVMPKYCDKYIGLDLGFRDLTAAVFGHVHFSDQVLHIQGELALRQAPTAEIAEAVKAKTLALWGELPTATGRVIRVSDNEPRFLADLEVDHKLRFMPARKNQVGQSKSAMIARLRTLVREGRITIDPSCKLLLETLFGATYAKADKAAFDRDEVIGHADMLDALIYLVNSIDWMHCPFPSEQPYKATPFDYLGPAPGMKPAVKNSVAEAFMFRKPHKDYIS